MYTISRLAKQFGLSRSTLLYYDKLGLLKPTQGGQGGYRYYTEEDAEKLRRICQYREMGLPLKEISNICNGKQTKTSEILEQRLIDLNDEILKLRKQQQLIIGILNDRRISRRIGVMNVEIWSDILRSAGYTEDDMVDWHIQFEHSSPKDHEAFLQFLCLSKKEIKKIRSWAKK